MDNRDILRELGLSQAVEMPNESGICSQAWLNKHGIRIFSNKQLAAVAKMLNDAELAKVKTKTEMVKEVFLKDEVDEFAPPNPKEVERLKQGQANALEEKKRIYKEMMDKK